MCSRSSITPRADDATLRAFRRELDAADVSISSVLPLYWWSGSDEETREAAVRYWKRAIDITRAARCGRDGSRAHRAAGKPRSQRSVLLALHGGVAFRFEHEGSTLRLEPHPDDFIEDGHAAVNLIRGINSPNVEFLYCTPHTLHMGNDAPGSIRRAGPLLTHAHIVDTFDHTASSGKRYIVNPPWPTARIHQHLEPDKPK